MTLGGRFPLAEDSVKRISVPGDRVTERSGLRFEEEFRPCA